MSGFHLAYASAPAPAAERLDLVIYNDGLTPDTGYWTPSEPEPRDAALSSVFAAEPPPLRVELRHDPTFYLAVYEPGPGGEPVSATTVWQWAEEVHRHVGALDARDFVPLFVERGDVGGHALLSGAAMTEHPRYDAHRTRLYSAEQDWVVEMVDGSWIPVTDPPSRAYDLRRWIEGNRPISDEATTGERALFDELSLYAGSVEAVEARAALLEGALARLAPADGLLAFDSQEEQVCAVCREEVWPARGAAAAAAMRHAADCAWVAARALLKGAK